MESRFGEENGEVNRALAKNWLRKWGNITFWV
jgi:hypothetical protein